MKKFTYILIIMTLLCFIIPSKAYASASYNMSYARVINDTTPFYSDSLGQNLMFYLPYTYYVKVIGEENGYYHVEYGGYSSNPIIDGYVPKDVLFFDEQQVSSPYPMIEVLSASACTLYLTNDMNTPIKHIFKNRVILPYGINIAPNGAMIYLVTYNGTLGYVYESDLTPFELKNHENALTFLENNANNNSITQSENEQPAKDKENNFLSLRIIIIVCLVFAGIIAFFVCLKNGSKKTTDFSSYYEENDFE